MITKAVAKYIRISPRKTRQVASLIRNKNPHRALAILAVTNKRPAKYVAKVVKSAISNLGSNPDIRQDDLYISRILIDGGPSLKRFRARAMGRATRILKRTSHITVELDQRPARKIMEQKPSGAKKTAKKKVAKKKAPKKAPVSKRRSKVKK